MMVCAARQAGAAGTKNKGINKQDLSQAGVRIAVLSKPRLRRSAVYSMPGMMTMSDGFRSYTNSG